MKKLILLFAAILFALIINAQNTKFIKKAYVEYDFEIHNADYDGSVKKEKVKVEDMTKIYLDKYTKKTVYNKLRKQHFTFRINDVRFDIPEIPEISGQEKRTYQLETMSAPNEIYWQAAYFGQYYQESDFLGQVIIEKVEGDYIWGSIKALKLWPLDYNGNRRDKSWIRITNVKFCMDKKEMFVDSKRK